MTRPSCHRFRPAGTVVGGPGDASGVCWDTRGEPRASDLLTTRRPNSGRARASCCGRGRRALCQQPRPSPATAPAAVPVRSINRQRFRFRRLWLSVPKPFDPGVRIPLSPTSGSRDSATASLPLPRPASASAARAARRPSAAAGAPGWCARRGRLWGCTAPAAIVIELDELAPLSHRPGGHAAEHGMSSGVPDRIARLSILEPPAEQRRYPFRPQIALIQMEDELGWQAPGPIV
jgi:hypothetical protein